MERNRTPSAVILGAQYLTSTVPHHRSSQKEAPNKKKRLRRVDSPSSNQQYRYRDGDYRLRRGWRR